MNVFCLSFRNFSPGVQHIWCCVFFVFVFCLFVCFCVCVSRLWWCPTHIVLYFLFCLSSSCALCTQCCQCLLECPFLIATSVSLTFINTIDIIQCVIIFFSFVNRYVFFCNDWLSDSKGDGKTHRQLFCAQSEFKDGNNLFSSLARFRIFDDHLLLSLFGRPTYSRFSRVQRLYCVAAMLSLSFLASAMFFRSGDNEHVHGITIGPVKITYKQLYVGIVTSVMTFPVGFLMGYIFRNRRFKPNVKDQLNLQDIPKDSAVLPWFTVFIGYGLAGIALANGVFFTTLYSVQWGQDVSTDWMMSILFGTTNGLAFIDPFKVRVKYEQSLMRIMCCFILQVDK